MKPNKSHAAKEEKINNRRKNPENKWQFKNQENQKELSFSKKKKKNLP